MTRFATAERVDRLKEDLDAIVSTVSEILGEQRWTKVNLRAIMAHLGVREVDVPDDPDEI